MNNNNSTYKRLGDYIREVDVRNTKSEVNLSQGICNQKYFQNPRQVSATPHLDKIVRKGQFAYNRATTRNGNKISIAYREGEDCTVSSAYCVFYIIDEEKLNPYYLWLWFKRPDFDRYAIFKSHGSAHEFFEFETLCDTYVPIPPIEEQRKIVDHYLAIQNRIANNKQTIAKLEEAAQALYRKMFVDGIDVENLPEGWRMGCLGEVAEINPTLKVKNELCTFIDMDAVSIDKMTTTAKGIREKTGGSKFQNEDVLLARITPCFENGKVGIVVGLKDQEIAIGSTEFIVLRGKELNMPMFLYLICKSNEFRAYGSKHLKGTDGRQRLDWQSVADYPIIIPPFEFMKRLNNSYDILFNFVQKLELENEKLTEMLSAVDWEK